MIYRTLGQSGLKVSALTLGTMMFGEQTNTEDSLRIIDKAWDQGINFIDTADVYTGGRSEELVGEAIARHRQDWVVASKVGFGPPDGLPNRSGLSRKRIFNALDASLTRLDTDYLDIYYLHREDHSTPLEVTISAIGDLIRQGKIRYWGLSNYRGWRIAEVIRVAERLGVDRPVISQPLYNIVNRQAEAEQITAAAAYGLGVVPYSPLARGVLSGKYAPDVTPEPGSRAARQDKRILETEWRVESLRIAQQIQQYTQGRGVGIVEFAIAWVLNNSAVSSAIVGPRTEAQWDAYTGALDVKITAEDEAFIDSLVTSGHSSTPGFNDVSHYVSGRVARS
ncbi:aldo/keto reductase [Pseudomonas sp. P7]|jgi:aryl-alcohol dehydrogenase-like predicted oxidoreductase|uniref:aldo/keto reductase n=1 Tax=Pseudomonas TaxID=286 RepID=UPI000450AC49|nr:MULTISPECIES: aldo/keto reductase [Pseudomonas]EZP67497.1 putative aldo/keto reductase [Pseudomonas sp. RIT357]MBA2923813.1 aldo/keto reductase [Pseudomonas sivasensis]MBA2928761.1 aldo/keto reductase [Pseudomonas sivasensis]MCT4497933.1 aldo/keto reductase [Pseudomonas sivasensis]OYT83028.1 MAG: aldo/keto reductase [Pseudomonas sp. PGPPP2]